MKYFVVLCLLSCVAFSNPAAASFEDAVTSSHYGVRAPARLAQGLANMALCWTALFSEPIKAAQKDDRTFVEGVFRGIGYPVPYLFLGAWDAATFWVPGQLGQDMSKVTKNVFNQP